MGKVLTWKYATNLAKQVKKKHVCAKYDTIERRAFVEYVNWQIIFRKQNLLYILKVTFRNGQTGHILCAVALKFSPFKNEHM